MTSSQPSTSIQRPDMDFAAMRSNLVLGGNEAWRAVVGKLQSGELDKEASDHVLRYYELLTGIEKTLDRIEPYYGPVENFVTSAPGTYPFMPQNGTYHWTTLLEEPRAVLYNAAHGFRYSRAEAERAMQTAAHLRRATTVISIVESMGLPEFPVGNHPRAHLVRKAGNAVVYQGVSPKGMPLAESSSLEYPIKLAYALMFLEKEGPVPVTQAIFDNMTRVLRVEKPIGMNKAFTFCAGEVAKMSGDCKAIFAAQHGDLLGFDEEFNKFVGNTLKHGMPKPGGFSLVQDEGATPLCIIVDTRGPMALKDDTYIKQVVKHTLAAELETQQTIERISRESRDMKRDAPRG